MGTSCGRVDLQHSCQPSPCLSSQRGDGAGDSRVRLSGQGEPSYSPTLLPAETQLGTSDNAVVPGRLQGASGSIVALRRVGERNLVVLEMGAMERSYSVSGSKKSAQSCCCRKGSSRSAAAKASTRISLMNPRIMHVCFPSSRGQARLWDAH